MFWPLTTPAYGKLPHIHWNSLLLKLRKTHGMSQAEAAPHQLNRTIFFLFTPFLSKGALIRQWNMRAHHNILLLRRKPSLQWVICYSLGEKDKVSTELFTVAYDWSLFASPVCHVASLWSFPLKLLRAHSSCTWLFADHTKKICWALEDAEHKWIQEGHKTTLHTWEVIFLWLIKNSMGAQI